MWQNRHAFHRELVFPLAMLKDNPAPARFGWRLATHSLSGRLLLLTILFVMLSVALIYFPSVARYHNQLLQHRSLRPARHPSFTEAPGEQFSDELRMQLLHQAGAEAVILEAAVSTSCFSSGLSRRRSRRSMTPARPI